MKQKLSSRKLWAAVCGVITGLAMAFGLDETIISTVAGSVTTVASVLAYIITEGKVDTAAVSAVAQVVAAEGSSAYTDTGPAAV